MIIEPKPIRGGNGQKRGRGRLSGGAGVSDSKEIRVALLDDDHGRLISSSP